MIGLLYAFFIAPILIVVLLYLRKLIKSMSKSNAKKFVKSTILADVFLIVLFAGINRFWKNVNAMDAVALSLLQGVKATIIPTFCIIQAYVVIMIAMCCFYKNFEPIEEDEDESK